ncbi:NADPH-dependent oxidoreductase 2-alkenal reductase-like [Coffea eugenioides]|uniref:NADPH-dependent oxidoreductase 2-alkenal reductase-like n=1 Tax=Coffea eugenioides TaxID=49369 RepID=UPI000F607C68|nr:NADPH-dependent oxidoreductase 2-alkenal reductase-like [Coffea eugenioides]
MEVTNRYVVIKHNIDGAPLESDFELRTEALSLWIEPGKYDVIVKNLYLSVDPYQLNRMKSPGCFQQDMNFAGAINPGQKINGDGIGRVVASGSPEFKEGDLVSWYCMSWGEYSIIKMSPSKMEGAKLRKIEMMEFPLSYHVALLSLSGITAYAGFFEVCKPKKGEKLFVSGASGSVGSLVGQYAKLFGCYVVGCAGSQRKVDLLKEKLGFDEAFNYKEETDLKSALKRYFPDGIDIYFDNVGGEMLEAAIENMNPFGRVAVCGAISEYTDKGRRAAPNMVNVVYKRITIQGFLAADHYKKVYKDFLSTTLEHLYGGRLHVLEDISHGVESLPSAFAGLFRGDNVGKKMVELLADD